jgi:hypothetical protein
VVQSPPLDPAIGSAPFAEAVITLADAGREKELVMLVAERAELDAAIVLEALAGPSTEAVAIVCRMARLPMNSYSAVLRMQVRKRRQMIDPYPLLAAYRQTATATSEELAHLLRQARRAGRS